MREQVTLEQLLEALRSMKVSKRQGVRARNKPLLLLHFLGRLVRGEPRKVSYADLEAPVGDLLERFGGRSDKPKPHYPFWRLEQGTLWNVSYPKSTTIRLASSGDPRVGDLRAPEVRGGFPRATFDLLQTNPDAFNEFARTILVEHFPEDRRDELAEAVGLGSDFIGQIDETWSSDDAPVRVGGNRNLRSLRGYDRWALWDALELLTKSELRAVLEDYEQATSGAKAAQIERVALLVLDGFAPCSGVFESVPKASLVEVSQHLGLTSRGNRAALIKAIDSHLRYRAAGRVSRADIDWEAGDSEREALFIAELSARVTRRKRGGTTVSLSELIGRLDRSNGRFGVSARDAKRVGVALLDHGLRSD